MTPPARRASDLRLDFEEPPAFRKFTASLVETALVTGVAVRLYRAIVLANADGSWIYWTLVTAVGIGFLVAMVTMHLANYPVRRWAWRAPAFALLAVGAEMVTSLGLIALGREPAGSVRAAWADWPAMAGDALLYRGLVIVAWSLALAAALGVARRMRTRRRRTAA